MNIFNKQIRADQTIKRIVFAVRMFNVLELNSLICIILIMCFVILFNAAQRSSMSALK